MALSIMRIMTAFVVMGVVFACMGTLFFDYGTPAASGSFYNTSKNTSATFANSTLNPFVTTAGHSLNLSTNLTSASQSIGFSFAFVVSDFGNLVTSAVQTPKTIANFLSVAMGNVGLVIGGNTALTTIVISAVGGLITFYLFLIFISAWMKYPLS